MPLNLDAFIIPTKETNNYEEDKNDIIDANNYLMTIVLETILYKLDSMQLIPIDSQMIVQELHSNGINIRYLGEIAKRTKLKHIKRFRFFSFIKFLNIKKMKLINLK